MQRQAYVTNLNVALEKQAAAEAKGDVAAMIALQGAIKFNGGGHVNHSLFWTNLAPASAGGGAPPEGELATYINKAFGTFEVGLRSVCAWAIDAARWSPVLDYQWGGEQARLLGADVRLWGWPRTLRAVRAERGQRHACGRGHGHVCVCVGVGAAARARGHLLVDVHTSPRA